jgi:hypothetical protein
LRNCKGILEEYGQTYGVLRVGATYAFWHVETYQKGELKREFLKTGIPFLGGIQKEVRGEIFRRNSLFEGSGKREPKKGMHNLGGCVPMQGVGK